MQKKIFTNIVEEKEMREIQSRTLKILRDALKKSFGPYGSNTTITKAAGSTVTVAYTKDGHKILQNILFQDVIETAVKENIEDITRNIVLKVGDGTTSAVILSSAIFDNLCQLETDLTPYQIIQSLKDTVELVKEEIIKHKQEFTPELAYKIALISTNGNVDVAENIANIYRQYGSDVYIDVTISPNEDSMLRVYDGLTLETGYADVAYVNTRKGISSLKNPQIFAFEDPIDSIEMGALLDAIIANNILIPMQTGKSNEVKPTVIFAPKISRDFSSYMEKLVQMLYNIENPLDKPPLLIVTNIHEHDKYYDITQLCGAKAIRKYINPETYKKDIEDGLAANRENVMSFAGSADLIESDAFKTKIINPKNMYKPGTSEYSDVFNNLLSFLEAELEKANNETNNTKTKYDIKKRIQSLKSNLVEYLVGGVSVSDRDSLRDLVEDAVKNCRSAAQHGVGYAANFEALRAINDVRIEHQNQQRENKILDILHKAYTDVVSELYTVSGIPQEQHESIIVQTLVGGLPYNVKTKAYCTNVLTSIQSDIIILDTVSKLMALMITTNQFICPDFIYNKYSEGK